LHQDGRDGDHDYLLPIAFHHQVMTAKPLFEIMRATIADKLKTLIIAGMPIAIFTEKF
jgi:hypothetical protein